MQPLLPEKAIQYLDDAQNLQKTYLKAVTIRYCLEAIVDTIFIHIARVEGVSGNWSRKKLYDKIESLKEFFPEEILQSIHYIRQVTNKGAHQHNHKDLTEEELSDILEKINNICEWVIISYFKKYGFEINSWVPTVFSTLQPAYRVRILETIFNYYCNQIENKKELLQYQDKVQKWHKNFYQQIEIGIIPDMQEKTCSNKDKQFAQLLLIIDKLAMAYVKNREYEKGIQFIDECYENGLINNIFKSQMDEKLLMLNQELDNLPIATSLQQAKENLKKILPSIREDEHSLFIVIFTAIVAQDELDNLLNITG
jgi:hypothetical protein